MFLGRAKQKDKWRDLDKEEKKAKSSSPPPKPKDKHNKLRETIEKLKAKSELSNRIKRDDFESDVEKTKENREHKSKKLAKPKNRRVIDLDDGNSTADSMQSENKKRSTIKNAAIEALTLATEQTLKDINKWLDDTPRLSEFSSDSNSPTHYIGAEEFDGVAGKIENDYRKRLEKALPKKEALSKDLKRRAFHHRDPTKFLKKREVQRTIDRLQPGKSKGNLLSNIQNANKVVDDLFPLGPLSKIKDTKNALIVKTDASTPKLSLGSVLDSFGKHKFVDDVKKVDVPLDDSPSSDAKSGTEKAVEEKSEKVEKKAAELETGPGKATPNLSAWFKAFGAPKVPPSLKKSEAKPESKEVTEKPEESKAKEVVAAEVAPSPESPAALQGQPAPRQRKMSTGSTVSERSSFSQDMDSPRVGIDERLGAYPAPYPSPLHRSPSGASPIMASPRPDVSPKAAYPTVNGQIRVGFYQDTVSTKSSPEKSCSPRDNQQSPYHQFSEHVYTPATSENASYSYNNPSYYSQIPSYTNPATPSYTPEAYYDTSKPLTDQYQAKATTPMVGPYPNHQTYQHNAHHPHPHQAINSPVPQLSPQQQQQQPPPQPLSVPAAAPLAQAPPPSYESFRQQQHQQKETAMFPVKKRAYNETEPPQENLYDLNNLRSTPQQYVHQNIPNPRGNPQNASSYTAAPSTNIYNYTNEATGYGERPLDLNARVEGEKKYANMGYSEGPASQSGSGDLTFNRNPQYGYGRPKPQELPPPPPPQAIQNNELMMRYAEPGDYRNNMPLPQKTQTTNYNDPHQSLGLRGNLTNLSHIVDRFSTENMYYEKGLAPHIYTKPMATSASSLPMFTQPYSHEMQGQGGQTMYNLQPAQAKSVAAAPTAYPPAPVEKKKRRKNAKSAGAEAAAAAASTPNQGFQSYTGLKEPSAISLKTASVVPGSAFNFGPSPTGLGLGSGLYAEKDTYPNFLEDYRSAPNYYMAAAAAAAHHRATPETGDKQARVAHQPPASAGGGYPFIGAPQPRPPSYPLSGPFMPPHQASSLMDPSSPLYQQYLQAGVLHQGLLGPPGAYPPGYHPALSMRQPFDSMTRPSWL